MPSSITSPIKKKDTTKNKKFQSKLQQQFKSNYIHISPHEISLDEILKNMPKCDVISNSDLMWAKMSGLYNIIGNQNEDGTYNSILLYTNPVQVDDNLPYIKKIKEKYPELEWEIKIHALCAREGQKAGKLLIEDFINKTKKNTLIYLQPSETNLEFLKKYYTEKVQPDIKKINTDFIYKDHGVFIWVT